MMSPRRMLVLGIALLALACDAPPDDDNHGGPAASPDTRSQAGAGAQDSEGRALGGGTEGPLAGDGGGPVGPTGEPAVQLSLGTQTGGSDSEPLCGEFVWEATEEAAPHTGRFVGAVQLEQWQADCERACNAAECSHACAAECANNIAPPGNARSATLTVRAVGPVERWSTTDADGNFLCPDHRRFAAAWSVAVDGAVSASGTGLMQYVSGSGASATYEMAIEEVEIKTDAAFALAAPGDFRELSAGQAKPQNDGGEVYLRGHLTFAEDEVLLVLDSACDDCCDGCMISRVAIPLARGVLRDEGAAARPLPARPDPRHALQWLWPAAECRATD